MRPGAGELTIASPVAHPGPVSPLATSRNRRSMGEVEMASTEEVEVEVEVKEKKSVRFTEEPAKSAAGEQEWWLREFKGITVLDYGRSSACFLVLYVILGCLYGAMMTIAVEVRGGNYMSLPSKYFGAFDRDQEMGTHFQAAEARPRGYTVPKGCYCEGLSPEASRALTGPCPDTSTAVICDNKEESKTARLYPWMVKYYAETKSEAVEACSAGWTRYTLPVSGSNMTMMFNNLPDCGNFARCTNCALENKGD